MEQEKKIKLNNHASFSSVRFWKPRHPRVGREMQSEAKKECVGSYHGGGGEVQVLRGLRLTWIEVLRRCSGTRVSVSFSCFPMHLFMLG